MYGPALPPGFIQGRTSAVSTVVGPLLPPGMTKADLRDEVESEGDDESEDAEDLIGPVPFTCDHEVTNAGALRDIERRASQMKNRLITGVRRFFYFILS